VGKKRNDCVNNDILTAAEAAEYLKLSVVWVRSLAAEGKLPGMQFGDDWRFMRGQLYDYLVTQAEAQQRARQGQHKVLQIAKQDGAIPIKRGRRLKTDTAAILQKYGDKF
jgi:excisionase family DNA binding protein